jgi:RimJ/RimL family protein N-acetyltransferase
MQRIETNEFVIRPTTADDLELLLAWHRDPDVYAYWERRPLTEREITRKYLDGRLASVRCFIIEAPPNEPVGFIQHADLDLPEEVGIDMFLIPKARGAGLGPRVARRIAEHLLNTGIAERVTVDPLLSNRRAIVAWRKAGFVDHSHIEAGDHGEPAMLLVFQRPTRTT